MTLIWGRRGVGSTPGHDQLLVNQLNRDDSYCTPGIALVDKKMRTAALQEANAFLADASNLTIPALTLILWPRALRCAAC